MRYARTFNQLKFSHLISEQSQISGENGEMYLFQWLSSTEKKIKDATPVRSADIFLVLKD